VLAVVFGEVDYTVGNGGVMIWQDVIVIVVGMFLVSAVLIDLIEAKYGGRDKGDD
jgi:hypothetical protein